MRRYPCRIKESAGAARIGTQARTLFISTVRGQVADNWSPNSREPLASPVETTLESCSGIPCEPQHTASRTRRTPLNCHLVEGGKKLRYVMRECPRGVARLPPRRTIWPAMNFPLYSLMAPGHALKPGYGSKDDLVHCQTCSVSCRISGSRAADSHSASVGSRAPAH
jgi:hypothetical protein